MERSELQGISEELVARPVNREEREKLKDFGEKASERKSAVIPLNVEHEHVKVQKRRLPPAYQVSELPEKIVFAGEDFPTIAE